jgi:hypothetical protein
MEIYCLSIFKDECDKILGKNSYKNLTEELYNYFSEKEISDILSGTRLNNSANEPYVKKRLDGRGGYRIYYLVKVLTGKVYLMFIHPKTGSMGSDNITPDAKAKIYKEVLEAIKTDNLLKVKLEDGQITYKGFNEA